MTIDDRDPAERPAQPEPPPPAPPPPPPGPASSLPPAEPEERYRETAVDTREVSDWYGAVRDRMNALLLAILAFIDGVLILRFILLAFGASHASSFVRFVLNVSHPFMRPFAGAFVNRTWDQGVIEVSTLLAIVVWALIFGLLALIVAALAPATAERRASYIRRNRIRST